jgi:hypothetical protein
VATKLLERAFTEASKLPEQEQDAFAAWILEELASEQRWEKAFADSEDVLTKLAEEAIADIGQIKHKSLIQINYEISYDANMDLT